MCNCAFIVKLTAEHLYNVLILYEEEVFTLSVFFKGQ